MYGETEVIWKGKEVNVVGDMWCPGRYSVSTARENKEERFVPALLGDPPSW
jgi:hypothetical protein